MSQCPAVDVIGKGRTRLEAENLLCVSTEGGIPKTSYHCLNYPLRNNVTVQCHLFGASSLQAQSFHIKWILKEERAVRISRWEKNESFSLVCFLHRVGKGFYEKRAVSGKFQLEEANRHSYWTEQVDKQIGFKQ